MVKQRVSYFARLKPHRGISAEKDKTKQKKHLLLVGERQRRRITEIAYSPLLQPWCVQLEEGYDHVLSEKTHLHPVDRFLKLIHFLPPVQTS